MQSPCYSLSKAIYGVFCDLSKPGLLQNFRGKAIETLSSSGWNYSANLTRYSPSEDTAQSGIWAARKTVKLVENDNLYYEVGVENTSTAVFIPFNSSYKSYGNVRITSNALPPSPYTVIVADTQGGPYTCDLSNPTLPTTGSNIMLNWSDDVVEPLLPNPQIGCPELVWQR